MQLLAVLGQYLLLTFVLPGFCYLLAFALCFPGLFRRLTAGLPIDEEGGERSPQASWIVFFAVIGGLLLSSITFAIEILLREVSETFNKTWFPGVDFAKIHSMDAHSLENLFTAMAFMHFNISVGILIILLLHAAHLMLRRTATGERHGGAARRPPRPESLLPAVCVIVTLTLIVVANIAISSHLFHRVDHMVRGA
jgi:hypothetical protein